MTHKAPTRSEMTAKGHAMLKANGYAKGGAIKNVNIIIKTGDKPTPVPVPIPAGGPPQPPMGGMPPPGMMRPPGAPMPPNPAMAPPPGMQPRPPGLKTGGVVKVKSHVRRKSGGKCE